MNKSWYKSKAIWVSVAGIISAIAAETGILELTPETSMTLLVVFLGLLGITLRDAVPKKRE